MGRGSRGSSSLACAARAGGVQRCSGALMRPSCGRSRGAGRMTSGPASAAVPILNYSNDFQMNPNLNWSKNGLLLL
jgi:hypothetical protein